MDLIKPAELFMILKIYCLRYIYIIYCSIQLIFIGILEVLCVLYDEGNIGGKSTNKNVFVFFSIFDGRYTRFTEVLFGRQVFYFPKLFFLYNIIMIRTKDYLPVDLHNYTYE